MHPKHAKLNHRPDRNDHGNEADAREMEALETEKLAGLGFLDPY